MVSSLEWWDHHHMRECNTQADTKLRAHGLRSHTVYTLICFSYSASMASHLMSYVLCFWCTAFYQWMKATHADGATFGCLYIFSIAGWPWVYCAAAKSIDSFYAKQPNYLCQWHRYSCFTFALLPWSEWLHVSYLHFQHALDHLLRLNACIHTETG